MPRLLTVLLLLSALCTRAQDPGAAPADFPFSIRLEPVTIDGLPGLQSYAFAVWQGRWVLMGGRTDGLHKRQPFASFAAEGRNQRIWLVDPASGSTRQAEPEGLDPALAEQLQSTNMQFFQLDSLLILTGGYGYSEIARDHRTHAALVVVKLPLLVRLLEAGAPIAPAFVRLPHEDMAVTGGRLGYMDGVFYLAGGQRFDGRYNPHGPNHGPGFMQQYTNAIRRFRLADSAGSFVLRMLQEWKDEAVLHRRDYNLLPQVAADGSARWTMYSGVFQPDRDLPFTSLVQIDQDGFKQVPDFEQRLNHYHTASLPLYHAGLRTSYAVFFGGIARHPVSGSGQLLTDDQVPFVKTVSVIAQAKDGYREWYLPLEMPGYLGASAEFIPAPGAFWRTDGILDLQRLDRNHVLAGYIVGGIESSAPNVFFSPPFASPSEAAARIWKVVITRKDP
ncbi:MAG: hypothetical protein MUF29_00210 [Chitinophagaceae bacterium]|nr:hypothetical protein [Chitinophagaceae bacterium]